MGQIHQANQSRPPLLNKSHTQLLPNHIYDRILYIHCYFPPQRSCRNLYHFQALVSMSRHDYQYCFQGLLHLVLEFDFRFLFAIRKWVFTFHINFIGEKFFKVFLLNLYLVSLLLFLGLLFLLRLFLLWLFGLYLLLNFLWLFIGFPFGLLFKRFSYLLRLWFLVFYLYIRYKLI